MAVQGAPLWTSGQSKDLHKDPGRGGSLPASPGTALMPYLGVLLIFGPSAAQVKPNTQKVTSVLQMLGWLVSMEKSSLEPAQVQTYLGRVDLRAQKLFLPREKLEKVVVAVRRLMGAPLCPRRTSGSWGSC